MLSSDDEFEEWLTSRHGPFALVPIPSNEAVMGFVSAPATLFDLIRNSQKYGTRPCIRSHDGWLSYNEAFAAATRLAHILHREFGVGPGHRVALALPNGSVSAISFLAIILACASAVLLCGTEAPVEELADRLSCDVLLTNVDRDDFTTTSSLIRISNLKQRECFTSFLDIHEYDLVRHTGEFLPKRGISADSEALISFSSGSTGRAKAIIHTHRSVISGLMNMSLAASIDARTRPPRHKVMRAPCALITTPFGHVSAYTQLLLQLMYGGRISFLVGSHRGDVIAELIERDEVTSVIGLNPPQTKSLINTSNAKLHSLSTVHIHGFSLNKHLAQMVREALPLALITTSYGLTETAGAITALSGDALFEKPTSSGRVVRSVNIKIISATGDELERGEPGEIWLQGPMLFYAYQQDRIISPIGNWFRTGDIGYLEEDRHLHVLDRAENIEAGSAVSCAQIEETIFQHQDVKDVAVYLKTNNDGQQTAVIGIVVNNPKTTDISNIRRTVERVSSIPCEIVLTETLPKTSSGKHNRLATLAHLNKDLSEEKPDRQS